MIVTLLLIGFAGSCIPIGVMLSASTRLVVASVLAVPEVFLPGLPIPLDQVLYIWLAVCTLIDRRCLRGWRITSGLAAGLGGWCLITSLWSISPSAGVGTGLRYLEFAIICVAILAAVSEENSAIKRDPVFVATKLLFPWLLAQASLTILFRLEPSIESSFLHGTPAALLIGPSAAGLFTGEQNNVLDIAKAGGFFVNANVASMFNGSCAALLLAVAQGRWKRWFQMTAVLLLTSVLFTGSKTGLALALFLPPLALILPRVLRPRGAGWQALGVAAGLLVAIAAPSAISAAFPGYGGAVDESLSVRDGLWDAAGLLFAQHPITGLGFGGWESVIAEYVGRSDYPPHNIIIAAWADTGIFGAVLTVAFLATATSLGLINIRRSWSSHKPETSWAFVGFLWIAIHGMGDNTTIFGDWRSMLTTALLVTLSTVRLPESDPLPPALDSRAGTSAVFAL